MKLTKQQVPSLIAKAFLQLFIHHHHHVKGLFFSRSPQSSSSFSILFYPTLQVEMNQLVKRVIGTASFFSTAAKVFFCY